MDQLIQHLRTCEPLEFVLIVILLAVALKVVISIIFDK